jgi:hypothetical protein
MQRECKLIGLNIFTKLMFFIKEKDRMDRNLLELVFKALLHGEDDNSHQKKHGEDDNSHQKKHPFIVGKSYFFRTVTYHCTGRVKRSTKNFVELEDAAWIADSGRFMDAIKNGKLKEVEPVGEQFVNIDSIVDAFPWAHDLPMTQK